MGMRYQCVNQCQSTLDLHLPCVATSDPLRASLAFPPRPDEGSFECCPSYLTLSLAVTHQYNRSFASILFARRRIADGTRLKYLSPFVISLFNASNIVRSLLNASHLMLHFAGNSIVSSRPDIAHSDPFLDAREHRASPPVHSLDLYTFRAAHARAAPLLNSLLHRLDIFVRHRLDKYSSASCENRVLFAYSLLTHYRCSSMARGTTGGSSWCSCQSQYVCIERLLSRRRRCSTLI